jgi:hypothetical protein
MHSIHFIATKFPFFNLGRSHNIDSTMPYINKIVMNKPPMDSNKLRKKAVVPELKRRLLRADRTRSDAKSGQK